MSCTDARAPTYHNVQSARALLPTSRKAGITCCTKRSLSQKPNIRTPPKWKRKCLTVQRAREKRGQSRCHEQVLSWHILSYRHSLMSDARAQREPFMKRSLIITAVGLLLAFTFSAAAHAGHEQRLCTARPRFEPGPIVNGHHRQPTQQEVKLRIQELQEWTRANGHLAHFRVVRAAA
jgi:hypothetical protein